MPAKSFSPAAAVEYVKDSVVSKPLLDKKGGSITLFAFDAGQKLSEHTAPYEAYLEIVEGVAEITVGGVTERIPAGQCVIIPGNVSHAVSAPERFKMILTMIQAG